MKLHCSKILLFSLQLNILITSSYVNNKNKPYITPHTSAITSRVLNECDLYMPNYDKDADMKSVKENFDRQSSRRFEEYEERMITNRQKYKEQCEKDIQKIILKDKIEKLLEEKVEKCCLICGCGLGGGVAPFVGLFGGLAVNEMKKAAVVAATDVGIKEAIKEVGSIFYLADGSTMEWTKMINAGNYSQKMSLVEIVTILKNKCEEDEALAGPLFCKASEAATESGEVFEFSGNISRMAANAAEAAGNAANGKYAEMTSVGTICSNPVVISAIVVVIIAVILLIIYLILRYRRKKKMKQKQQYTKLLNQ
ncbi:rifin [Plasmodium falciparum NF54]|uniref:Rifin n=2 Tax=Plasmodium falciparum TaxID=5833 RepID=Q8I493_PLAF7|nr:rifin [Plasmodium falciparum 3D7]KAF4328375.1 rifin [Plasmodium falciparum NF54]PKC45829.1 rifin [Plasmodium falciparum NF54]CAD51371.2 rifin [Plasmodium falciparum 3D7]|eukprot:XP_001351566.2 rifin [Plasmodium falciparum 3D7]